MCSDVESIVEAGDRLGYPIVLRIKSVIELMPGKHDTGIGAFFADLVRLAKNSDEAKEIASSMLKNTTAQINAANQRKTKELEKVLFQLNAKVKVLSGKVPGLKQDEDALNQCKKRQGSVQEELRKLADAKRARPPMQIEVAAAGRQDSLFLEYEYTGHPMWDPELATCLMPCDFANAALRAAYSGARDAVRRLGPARELRLEFTRLRDRPAEIAGEMADCRRAIAQLEHEAAALAIEARQANASDPGRIAGVAARQAALELAAEEERDRLAHPAHAPPLDLQINAVNCEQVTRNSRRVLRGGIIGEITAESI
jgi:hypothetical protein